MAFVPELADTTTYHFMDESGNSRLTVRRLNYTTIKATFIFKEAGLAPVIFDRLCDLGCGFILGMEIDDGDEGAYSVDEYWSRDKGYSFRIGKDGNRLTASVILGHFGTNRTSSPRMFHVQ